MVLEGDPAPGTPSEVNYSGLGFPVLNSAGQTAFSGFLTGDGVDSANNTGIWSEGSGPLALVAREGDQAQGTPSGANYGRLRGPLLNSAGQTAFDGLLTGSGVGSTNNSGIWSEAFGLLALVAHTGNQATGTAVGVDYSDFWYPCVEFR